MKLSYVGTSSFTTIKFLSTQAPGSGKIVYVKLTQNPKPVILPPELPLVPFPVQNPVVEVPGCYILKKEKVDCVLAVL